MAAEDRTMIQRSKQEGCPPKLPGNLKLSVKVNDNSFSNGLYCLVMVTDI